VYNSPVGTTLDAGTLRDAMAFYLEALRDHRQEIDSLNVFPVPDGDTGRNLLMTQQAVADGLQGLDGTRMAGIGDAISRAALMGARGNSGVILSQMLRGFCRRLCREEQAGAEDLAEALEEAASDARRAVASPVEGTMLSVLSDGARAAREACGDGADAEDVAAAALGGAEESLARTPELLPALAQAGVVDAGGRGIVLLLDAVRAAVSGVSLSVAIGPLGPIGEVDQPAGTAGPSYGYEVMYLLECADESLSGLRERLEALGDSIVVVGGGGLYSVHVHSDDPAGAVEEGTDTGRPHEIRVVSLDRQVAEACPAGQARAVRVGEADVPGLQRCALVAVVSGDGTAALFRSLGARVVAGGNPSVGEIAAAIAEAPSDSVILLPNDRIIVPATQQAAAGAGKTVTVIPTGSVPEGLAAATAFNPEADYEENVTRAREAATRVTSVEVAVASRRADTAAGPARPGAFLGLAGGEVRTVGGNPIEVALEVLRPLVVEGHEVLTVLTGDGTAPDEADRVASALTRAFPALMVDVLHGGQPNYRLLIGLE
jgi:DAK2 domain fusion protein YloV